MLSANDVITERIYKKNTETNVRTVSAKTVINLSRKKRYNYLHIPLICVGSCKTLYGKRGGKGFCQSNRAFIFIFISAASNMSSVNNLIGSSFIFQLP